MTYVSEPYLHIADQVLTALTGGAAREVNRFLPQANSFGFERDASRVAFDTVTIVGQAHKEFFAFQQGRDYSITDGQIVFMADEEDASNPASGATWPDEGSEFFVSYYHADSAKAPLTDRNVGSLTRTLAESFARELAILQRQLELVYKSGFIDTAEGSALDMVVAILGVERKDRQFASGIVRFFRDSPAPADIFVPEGTLVSTSTDPVVAFTTNTPRTLRRGQLSVEAEIRAEEPGATGVVAAGAINVVNQTILGISGVTNESPTVFGGSAESDEELRGRAKKVLERVGRATPGAIMHSLTQVGGLKENEIKLVEELQLRPGVVKVFVARDPSADLAADVQQAILESRAAGVRFEHNLDVALLPSPEGGLSGEEGREPGETALTGEGGDFRQSFCCDVFVFPQNPRATGPERSAMESAIVSAVTGYVEAAPIGGTLVYNRVVGDIMAVAGVLDVVLNIAPVDGSATSCQGMRNIALASGQKATIAVADVKVRFAGAPVNFDFQILVTPLGDADLDDIRTEIRSELVSFFATGPTTIAASDLMVTLGVSDLYALAVDDLTWIAEYDQAGLIVREEGGADAATTIAATDRASLREVSVEIKEVIEG